jgi:hypothetical protein
VNLSLAEVADLPPVAATVTSVVPMAPEGETAVSWVAEFTVNEVAAVAPKLTAVVPVNSVPVTVTEVPPSLEPLVGLRPLTVGAAT